MVENLIEKLQKINVVVMGDFVLKGGDTTNYYIDIKKAYGYPNILNLICNHLWQKIDSRVTCLACSGYGGIPPATVLSIRYNVNLSLVRDEEKKHGKSNRIEGYIPTNEDKVWIIDDVFTTGGNLKQIIETIEDTGAEILGCSVAVKRGESDIGIPVSTILFDRELFD